MGGMTENLKSPDAGLVAEARECLPDMEDRNPFAASLIDRLADRLEALSTPPQAPSLDDEPSLRDITEASTGTKR